MREKNSKNKLSRVDSHLISISELSLTDRAHKRRKKVKQYADRTATVRQAAQNVLEERLRHVQMGNKRQLRERQEAREKGVFSMIIKQPKDFNAKLQAIVDTVRPLKSQLQRAIGGLIPTEMHCMPTRVSEAEKGKLKMLSTRPRSGEEKQRSLCNRATGRIKAWGRPGWIEKSNIAYKWLRIRD